MITTSSPDPSDIIGEAPWYFPCIRLKLADGTWLLKPGKPIQRANANQVSAWTGISKKNLDLLAQVGFIRQCRPTPKTVLYYPAEVEAFCRRTEEDPDFWTDVRRQAIIASRRLRDSRFRPPQG